MTFDSETSTLIFDPNKMTSKNEGKSYKLEVTMTDDHEASREETITVTVPASYTPPPPDFFAPVEE